MGKVEVSQDGVKSLFNELKDKINEERNHALERFRRQDDTIENNEQFILQGKPLVDFLKLASDRTDALMTLTKMITDIVYKDESKNGLISNGDDAKREILKYIEENDIDLEAKGDKS